ncbi:hypothetical protein Golob_002093 [Gossypium lobatum]|uniref:Uncharacterized protein n=1 Tax=Gossypium lobatum TaxID=34289 RepID=A0A7J8N3X8_9ROSI|nr:hypothetical protein [Gossypium lobatum]
MRTLVLIHLLVSLVDIKDFCLPNFALTNITKGTFSRESFKL